MYGLAEIRHMNRKKPPTKQAILARRLRDINPLLTYRDSYSIARQALAANESAKARQP